MSIREVLLIAGGSWVLVVAVSAVIAITAKVLKTLKMHIEDETWQNLAATVVIATAAAITFSILFGSLSLLDNLSLQ